MDVDLGDLGCGEADSTHPAAQGRLEFQPDVLCCFSLSHPESSHPAVQRVDEGRVMHRCTGVMLIALGSMTAVAVGIVRRLRLRLHA